MLQALEAPAQAFHNGGVAACEGCHTMHNSRDGLPAPGNPWLLTETDPSSICLNCHAGSGSSPGALSVASEDGTALTPGGDFYWLNKTFTWTDGSSAGERHGHNIAAADFGFTQDGTLLQAPGGTYPSASLGCTSCHDPHGKVRSPYPAAAISGSGSYGGLPASGTVLGNFRLLGDAGYRAGNPSLGVTFTADAPVARANPDTWAESDLSHTDYGTGMSEWCGNCHPGYLTGTHTTFLHPAGNPQHLSPDVVNVYNTYVSTGNMTGTIASAYLALVPFERGQPDATLLDPTGTVGPDTAANVMCLTCHRAHASAFPSAGRWDFSAVLIQDSHPALGDAGVTGNDMLNSYYGRDMVTEFGPLQGTLCQKCHGE